MSSPPHNPVPGAPPSPWFTPLGVGLTVGAITIVRLAWLTVYPVDLHPDGAQSGSWYLSEMNPDRGSVRNGLQFVVEERWILLPPILGVDRSFGEGLTDSHHHATFNLTCCPCRVDDHPGVMGGADLEDTDHTSLLI